MSDENNNGSEGMQSRHLVREAREVGCYGLVDGFAVQSLTQTRVAASMVTKFEGPFHCGKCLTPAVVHKDRGGGKREHFAHSAPLTPIARFGETAFHKAAKEEIRDALRSIYAKGNWDVERTLEADANKGRPELRPDVSGRIGKQPIAIEIQWSTLSITQIIKRSIGYKKWRIPVLWLLPIKQDLVGEFRPRLFERYLHSMYFGRVYYWKAGDGITVTPIHFDPAQRWVDHREWVDSDGEQSAGGYTKRLRVLKTANAGSRISIDGFFAEMRQEFTPWNEKLAVPELLLWRDGAATWWDSELEKRDYEIWDEED